MKYGASSIVFVSVGVVMLSSIDGRLITAAEKLDRAEQPANVDQVPEAVKATVQ